MIERLFTTSFTVSRQQYTGAISAAAEIGSFSGHIQQLGGPDTINVAQGLSVTHRVWCALSTDVDRGDTIDDGSNSYSVRAVQRLADGRNTHLELLVEMDVEVSV